MRRAATAAATAPSGLLFLLACLSAGQDLSRLSRGLGADAADCQGTSAVSAEVWEIALNVDLLTRFAHVPLFMVKNLTDAFFRLQEGSELEAALDDCPFGLGTALLNALPEVERRLGHDKAKSFYALFEVLRRWRWQSLEESSSLPELQLQRRLQQPGTSVSQSKHHVLTFFWEETVRTYRGPAWTMTSELSPSFPFLLGTPSFEEILRGERLAAKEKVRIYVYESPLAVRPLGCSWGMSAVEVFIHKFFAHACDCRTDDPDTADFFFVPSYTNCLLSDEGKLAAEMDDLFTDLIERHLPYFSRRGGRDHIFLWSSETYDYPSWASRIHSSIFLTVESQPIMCSNKDLWHVVSDEAPTPSPSLEEVHCWHCSSCFQPFKDMVIPGFVSRWELQKLRDSNKPLQERTYLACYHGSDSSMRRMYLFGNATVRRDLQSLKGAPHTSIGVPFPIATDYYERIGQCLFCFVPKGLGYWSNRLFEVMFAGCIPVILSDALGLPFEDFIDWPATSIKWPMDEVGYPLLQHLAFLAADRVPLLRSMHDNVQKNSCWFNYHDTGNTNCSPYVGILSGLATRKRAMPTTPGPFWSGPYRPGEPGRQGEQG